jgi:N-acetylmuramoyl-L-alanine amidase
MKIAISSGHGSKIRGASDIIDEVDEARRVVKQVVSDLVAAGVAVEQYHDDVSTTQNENLHRIVDWHNSRTRDLDVSVHFNCYQHTSKPMGTECLYVTQAELAEDVSLAIADAGDFIDRGPKKRTDLYFLNNTEKPAILIETCFVDSEADVGLYTENFPWICSAIAGVLGGEAVPAPEPEPDDLPVSFAGTCSWFGGPDDGGVAPDEGLAFLYEVSDAPDLFLPQQPPGTTGLARRLDPDRFYVAVRWNYDVTPKEMLRDQNLKALVRAGGNEFLARPADWGPNSNTGRAADISPGLMEALEIDTDDQVEVIYPAPVSTPQPEPEPQPAMVAIQITSSGPVTVTVNGTPIGEL